MQQKQTGSFPQLSRTPGSPVLWGMGVGYVISGMYFGWNPDPGKGGAYGLAIATFFGIILCVTFALSYTELACTVPKAGTVLGYTDRAPRKDSSFIAGLSQIIEFGRIKYIPQSFSKVHTRFKTAVNALISPIAMTTLNGKLAVIYFGILALAYIWFHFVVKKSLNVSPVNN